MIKIWSMKAKEAAAEKKKPKTSAAQIRVQKGKRDITTCFAWRSLWKECATHPMFALLTRFS
jgi:hypothetical protein